MKQQATQFRLLRGGINLGLVKPTHDDFPWHYGDFEADSGFKDVENLFQDELEILERTKGNQEWDAAYQRISSEELRLEPVGPGKVIVNPLVHVRGDKVWWR